MALSTGSATGEQGSTQNPQTLPTQTIGASPQSGGVQTGTPTSVLTSNQGLSLNATPVTTVDLGPTSGSTASTATSHTTSNKPLAKHHVNAALYVFSIVLVLIAVGLFAVINRSAKSTTNY